MSRDTQQLWTQLRTAGLVEGELPTDNAMASPWYIKVLLAFSGWLAAIFLMAFLAIGIEIILRDDTASLIIGILMVAGAYGLLRIPRNEFIEHLALAISLAGQGWIVYSFFEFMDDNTSSIWWLIGIMQCLLAWVMPNFIHRVFSSFVAALAFSVALTYVQLPYLFSSAILFGAAWLWLYEFDYSEHLQKIHALGYGLVLALIVLKGTTLFGQDLMIWHYRYNEQPPLIAPWMGEVCTGLVVLFLIRQLLQRYFTTLAQPAPLVMLIGTFVLCLVSLEARGITVGLMILLLGFANSNRVLMGLGIIGLLFYISTYYYLLDTTLLNKSLSLLVIGAVLLAWRWSLLRFIPITQEKHHD